jgi:pyridoxamine 5'-phosphate oxidase
LDAEYATRPRVATLATVDAAGRPRARSVVLREIDNAGRLHVLSDARSDKNAHLRAAPFAELVFWLPNQREQYRLAGRATLTRHADDTAQLHHFWTTLSDASRALFAWPPPGKRRHDNPADFPTTLPASTPVPDTFELITLHPDTVERLQLTGHPHRRTRWLLEGPIWSAQDVNP